MSFKNVLDYRCHCLAEFQRDDLGLRLLRALIPRKRREAGVCSDVKY